jgi:DNA-binding MarR family transcriptional regulator
MNDGCALTDVSSNLLLTGFLRASWRVESRVECSLAGVGLSLAKLGVLGHLVEGGEPLPLSRLAEKISCVKSNMTQLVDRMEADGLVSRVHDPSDRRSIRAAITEEGRRRYEAGSRVLEEAENAYFNSLPPAERERLQSALSQLATE